MKLNTNKSLNKVANRVLHLLLTLFIAFIFLFIHFSYLAQYNDNSVQAKAEGVAVIPPQIQQTQLISSPYEIRRAQLLTDADQEFVDDPMRAVETALDMQPFDEINKMSCPKPIDNADGWSVEFRTGGRPFMNFDIIRINGVTWTLEMCTQGSSMISPPIITDHYSAGKTVNRLWFLHLSSSGVVTYPIVLAMTSDGFFNPGGALSPTLQGAVARMGFIGEPFSTTADYLQHVDELDIFTNEDDDTIRLVYSIHSEAGEGALEFELHWDTTVERPVLKFRSAHAVRTNPLPPTNQFGFAGFNFMRGPTLSGLLSQSGSPEGGIEAFHDGRSVFFVPRDGGFIRNLLTPPVYTSTIIYENLTTNATAGSKLIMDQPQDAEPYFSKFPVPPYEQRTDLVLNLISSTVELLNVRRAQTAVDLISTNPEANETVNVFYSAQMTQGVVHEFSYELSVDAQDFEELYSAQQQGVVFISNRSEAYPKLYFQALDANLLPVGLPIPLTDGVISDLRQPSAAANGRYIIFDADDYRVNSRQRIYTIDLLRGHVRRLTVDPFGTSDDWGASFNQDHTLYAMITSRQGINGNFRLNIESVTNGLGGGFGNDVVSGAIEAHWSQANNEIAFINYLRNSLNIYNVTSSMITNVISNSNNLQTPRFSPNGGRIAYVADTNLYSVNRDGLSNTLLISNTLNPTWVNERYLIVQRTINGNTDLYLLDSSTGQTTQLTSDTSDDIEPTFVPALGPNIVIESPANNAELGNPVVVRGFVASLGAPVVRVNGVNALVNQDHWSIPLTLTPGVHILTAVVTDTITNLASQDTITITIVDMNLDGPQIGLIAQTHAFTAAIASPTITLPLTYTWQTAELPTVVHPNTGLQDSNDFTWTISGTKIITVTAANGLFTITRTKTITLYTPTQATFSASPVYGPPPLTVTFMNSSTGDYDTTIWSFGDGYTTTDFAPIHIYHSVGIYTVTLTVEGFGGADTTTKPNYVIVQYTAYLPFITRDD